MNLSVCSLDLFALIISGFLSPNVTDYFLMKIRAFLSHFDSLINDNLNNNPQLIGSSISDVNRLSPN